MIVLQSDLLPFYDDCFQYYGSRESCRYFIQNHWKRNLEKGFRVVFEDPNAKEKKDILPSFVVGEKGPHQPSF
jgi:DNA topoisomerase-3